MPRLLNSIAWLLAAIGVLAYSQITGEPLKDVAFWGMLIISNIWASS